MVNSRDVKFISDLEFWSHSQQELLFQTDLYIKSNKAKGVVNDTPVDRPNKRATRYLMSFSSPCATQSGIAKSTLYPLVFLIWI